MYSCAWPGIPTAPGVGSDAQVFRKRWASSVARGGVATPSSVDSGVFYWYSYCCPGVPFHIFPNALLRLPQNSYSARWVSDPGIPWQGIHAPLIWFLGIPMGIPMSGIPSTPGGK